MTCSLTNSLARSCRVEELIEYISSAITLQRGDVILTGTPEGVGPIAPGQQLVASIPGVVELTMPVVLKRSGLTQQFFGAYAQKPQQ